MRPGHTTEFRCAQMARAPPTGEISTANPDAGSCAADRLRCDDPRDHGPLDHVGSGPPRGLPAQPAAPADNPSTPERVALGRLLFRDPILSGQKDVACATCHHPSFGYADGLDLSIGANGVGPGREDRSLPAPATNGQAQQPDRPERGFQRPDRRRRCQRHGRADVLGSQGSEPRGAGSGADQGPGRNARRRLPEDRASPRPWSPTERHRRVPPPVCSARSAEAHRSTNQPRAGAGGVSAHAGRLQYAVRSLHARRHHRA